MHNSLSQAMGMDCRFHSRKQCFRLAETPLRLDRVNPMTLSKALLLLSLSAAVDGYSGNLPIIRKDVHLPLKPILLCQPFYQRQ